MLVNSVGHRFLPLFVRHQLMANQVKHEGAYVPRLDLTFIPRLLENNQLLSVLVSRLLIVGQGVVLLFHNVLQNASFPTMHLDRALHHTPQHLQFVTQTRLSEAQTTLDGGYFVKLEETRQVSSRKPLM